MSNPKYRAVPQIPSGADPQIKAVLSALKENFEISAGQRGVKVELLEPTATTAQIIAKINELIGRIT